MLSHDSVIVDWQNNKGYNVQKTIRPLQIELVCIYIIRSHDFGYRFTNNQHVEWEITVLNWYALSYLKNTLDKSFDSKWQIWSDRKSKEHTQRSADGTNQSRQCDDVNFFNDLLTLSSCTDSYLDFRGHIAIE